MASTPSKDTMSAQPTSQLTPNSLAEMHFEKDMENIQRYSSKAFPEEMCVKMQNEALEKRNERKDAAYKQQILEISAVSEAAVESDGDDEHAAPTLSSAGRNGSLTSHHLRRRRDRSSSIRRHAYV